MGDLFMRFSDKFFEKVEKKTKVDKGTIVSLAEKLQSGNLKDENTIREVIHTLSVMTGREVDEERENRIVETILKDDVPKNIEEMF